MSTNFQKVQEFHRVFSVDDDPQVPTIPSKEILELRWKLISEEYLELRDELFLTYGMFFEKPDLAKVAKEMADLLYVIYGTYAAMGIDADKVFAEVHASNMSKLGEDGKPIRREDGKVLKGPNYRVANIESVLNG